MFEPSALYLDHFRHLFAKTINCPVNSFLRDFIQAFEYSLLQLVHAVDFNTVNVLFKY